MLFWQWLGTTVFFINISNAWGFRSLSNWQKSFICHYGIIWRCQSYRRRANARNVSLVINSVDKTKLPCHTSSPTQHHSLFRNLPLFMTRLSSKVKPLLSRSVNLEISCGKYLIKYKGLRVGRNLYVTDFDLARFCCDTRHIVDHFVYFSRFL